MLPRSATTEDQFILPVCILSYPGAFKGRPQLYGQIGITRQPQSQLQLALICLICLICTYRKRDVGGVHVRVVTVRCFRVVAVARLHAQKHLAEPVQIHPKRADEVEVSKSSHRGKPMVEATRR